MCFPGFIRPAAAPKKSGALPWFEQRAVGQGKRHLEVSVFVVIRAPQSHGKNVSDTAQTFKAFRVLISLFFRLQTCLQNSQHHSFKPKTIKRKAPGTRHKTPQKPLQIPQNQQFATLSGNRLLYV